MSGFVITVIFSNQYRGLEWLKYAICLVTKVVENEANFLWKYITCNQIHIAHWLGRCNKLLSVILSQEVTLKVCRNL